MSKFIYGKDETENVVALEVSDSTCELFIETESGVETRVVPNQFWILYAKNYSGDLQQLNGDMYYSWAKKFDTEPEYRAAIAVARAKKHEFYYAYNREEMFMLRSGVTQFLNMRPENVSILSIDIETTSLNPTDSDKVLLIANTFRRNGKTERTLFSYDDYNSQKEMVYAWANYVREKDPSIIIGHNILGFDLPYLNFKGGKKLPIGRDGSSAKFNRYESQFRKDGSQSYGYYNCRVYGRQIIDTFHLSIKFDIARNYPSYKLKEIIDYEGLQKSDRQFFDASTIRDRYGDPSAWAEIKEYCKDDADDALALFDLMIPNYFYYSRHIPKTFQSIISGATGSQVNSFMVRAYLQDGHGLPKASEASGYEGAISFGNPGIYKHVNKVDVASLYPSIILKDKIYDKSKDPKAYFLQMVQHFTTERLTNKALARSSGDRYYSDLEQSQKIFINSAYGFMGAPGLLFNSPDNAAQVTRVGREILKKGIELAEATGYEIVNADTDSFSYTTGKKHTDFQHDIDILNTMYKGIVWEDDGQFKTMVVVKAKNYVLDDGKKVKIKGSSLKATMKEPALKDFINDIIRCLLKGRKDELYDIYVDYVHFIRGIDASTISQWCSKKTITKAVLHPERTNEQRIREAITVAENAGQIQKVSEGDKIFVFFKEETELALLESFNGVYCEKKLYNKLYKTLSIFNTIIDVDVFPNFALKRNEARLPKVYKEVWKESC